ncbi:MULTISPECIES: anti-sigma factor [Pseudofrankia]|uniref:Anti-sigma factor n=1 Tax=Pseudofrankia asymbiotica TaxID=1834516 RepID=A0A1V2IL15_9ACTN|nr:MULTISPECIES: anti-sigma factor [Pseudofrankia]MDT3441138.1 anti-sigma factor [Pseudofrankia sp. BMG5.37]OHV54261.1 anti-sigma factor [Pseudofrankia sp. BMG5.36]ONH33797.1 anti-sigma factor [Pseudofrankia asymbiotica]
MDPTPSAGGTVSSGGVHGGGLRDVVQLTLPAASAYLTVLRTATASLAARLDFTLDDIEDLRIAVDEASALLLVSAVPGSALECVFALSPGVMRVTVSVDSLDGEPPSKDTFAWTVLDALAGEVSSSTGPGQRVTIELAKRQGARADLGEPPAGHVRSRSAESTELGQGAKLGAVGTS